VAQFFDVLRGLVASERAHLENIQGNMPETHRVYGWPQVGRGGERVGWVDDKCEPHVIYLDPVLAYSAVFKTLMHGHTPFPWNPATLWHHLRDRDLVVTEGEEKRTQVKRTVMNKRRRVIQLKFNPFDEESCPEMPSTIETVPPVPQGDAIAAD
jgi:hypothetical protein